LDLQPLPENKGLILPIQLLQSLKQVKGCIFVACSPTPEYKDLELDTAFTIIFIKGETGLDKGSVLSTLIHETRGRSLTTIPTPGFSG
jgi:hypothetical protein